MNSNPLAPPDSLQSGVSTTGSSLQTIDTVAQGILTLPVDSSTVAPSLKADMQAAQALATQWNNDIRTGVVNTLNGISSYNTLFASLFNTLYSLSEQIAAGDSLAIPPFQATLQQLYEATLQEAQAVAVVQQSLITYSSSVSTSQNALNADASQLQSEDTADKTEMDEMNQAMDYLETQEQIMYDKIIMERNSPMRQQLTILMDELEQSQQKLNDQMNALGDAMGQEQQQLNDLQKDLNDLSSYLTDLSQLQGGVSSLANGWEALSGDYANLLEDEDIDTYGIFTPDDVETAARDWAELSELAQSFLTA